MTADGRNFLFLQGPHGPFFAAAADALRQAGAGVTRVAFNAGDAVFWGRRAGLIRFDEGLEAWPAFFTKLLATHNITDILLYGDIRPVHKCAIDIATGRRLNIHILEEGYLRPYWVTYTNGPQI